MGSRLDTSKLRKNNDSPGPGAYQPEDTKVKKKEPNYKFGTDKRLKTAGKTQYPDPASYDVKDDIRRKTGQAWGMGYGTKTDFTKNTGNTPGPGSYKYKSSTTDGKKYGMGAKIENSKSDNKRDSPGPGAYSPSDKKSKNKAPEFGFGTSSRLQKVGNQNMPDPASYEVKDDIRRKTGQSWGMGYGTKTDFTKTMDNTPGPGSYEYPSKITEGKS